MLDEVCSYKKVGSLIKMDGSLCSYGHVATSSMGRGGCLALKYQVCVMPKLEPESADIPPIHTQLQ